MGSRVLHMPHTALCTPLIALPLFSACGMTDVVAIAREPACVADAGACAEAGTPDAGACAAQVCAASADEAAFCAGSGDLVQVGSTCAEDGSGPTYGFALCSCSDLVSADRFNVEVSTGDVPASMPGSADIGANRDLVLSGSGSVAGEARVVRESSVSPAVEVAVRHVKAPPCACEAERLLDVAALVARYRDDNDNAANGLRADALDGFSGNKSLTLSCGRYFFTRLKGDALDLFTQGNVAIFVEANIELNASLRIHASGQGQVSVFVAGEALVGGALALGDDPGQGARVHLYLGGIGTLDLTQGAQLLGNLYAPRVELVVSSPYEQYGALFVKRLSAAAEMRVHYDPAAAREAACGLSSAR